MAVQTVFDRLRLYGLTAKPAKCYIGFDTIKYLGFKVGRGIIETQEDKVSKILNFKKPTSKKMLRSFLGLFSFYRKFIEKPADEAHALNLLLKGKSDKLEWTTEAELGFERIKSLLASRPILKLPDPMKTFVLRTGRVSCRHGERNSSVHR